MQRGIGDVLIAWENEAFLSLKEFGADKFEIVVPSVSILAEPPVAVVDKVVDKHGTRKLAEAYLKYPVQRRGPGDRGEALLPAASTEGAGRADAQFPKLKLFTVDETFGGWSKAQKTHFADGGVFDQIYQPQ